MNYYEYFPEDRKYNRINDLRYQRDVENYLNNIRDQGKLNYAIMVFRHNKPDSLHMCSSEGCPIFAENVELIEHKSL